MWFSDKLTGLTRSCLLVATCLSGTANAQIHPTVATEPKAESRYAEEREAINTNVVYMAAGAPTAAYAKIAEDIQIVLEDEQAKEMRVLPTMSRGGGQNFVDVMMLRGLDLGLVEQDHMQYFSTKHSNLYGDVRKKVQYITKLYNSEFHILAKNEVISVPSLEGKKVNFFKKFSSTGICAENVFNILGIKVEPTYYDDATAIQKLKAGEIAGIARLGGAPLPVFASLKPEDGLHFVSLDEASSKYASLLEVYAPLFLRNDAYPGLIKDGETVLSIANATVLVTYAWPANTERYARIARFVDRFFSRFGEFSKPGRHPKWKEVNLAAELGGGWQRFPAAKLWLANNGNAAKAGMEKMKTKFDQFLIETKKTSAIQPQDRDLLMKDFEKWYEKNKK